MSALHVSRVRALYRRILLLHRVLPPDLKDLGDQYVKDEFRRHKTAGSKEAERFLQEWEKLPYCFPNWLYYFTLSPAVFESCSFSASLGTLHMEFVAALVFGTAPRLSPVVVQLRLAVVHVGFSLQWLLLLQIFSNCGA